jgi:hypothetical protein
MRLCVCSCRFDKSFCVIVSENGHAGLNGEHSWADAPVMAVRARLAVA